MISCRLYGRMANTMYQMAAVIGVAVKYNMEYCFPAETANPSIWKRYFPHLPTCNHSHTTASFWKEPSHAYTEIPGFLSNNLVIDGFFQSYRYFDFCIDVVRDEFGFNYDPINGVCALHVRRSDYLLYPLKHPVCSAEYYIKAMIKVFRIKRIKKFKVYSDDIKWCKEVLGEGFISLDEFAFASFEFSEETDEVKDFEEMMRNEAIITANSSYSVMAATLNPNPNKLVICPHEDNYFGIENKHLDVSTLYPPEFIRIKY